MRNRLNVTVEIKESQKEAIETDLKGLGIWVEWRQTGTYYITHSRSEPVFEPVFGNAVSESIKDILEGYFTGLKRGLRRSRD